MRFSTASIFFATTYLTISAKARPHPAPAATYNVVDVGGPTDSAEDQPATIYETVKTTLPVQQTITEVSPAAATTTIQVATTEEVTATSTSTSTTSKYTVVIAGGEATITSTSTSSAPTSSSTSTSCTSLSSTTSTWSIAEYASTTSMPSSSSISLSSTWSSLTSTTEPVYPSIPVETAPASTSTHTADDGFYHPTGDLGLYRTFSPSATASSTSVAAAYYPGVAQATGWAAPWNSTGNYVKRGFAAPSGRLPSTNMVKHLDML